MSIQNVKKFIENLLTSGADDPLSDMGPTLLTFGPQNELLEVIDVNGNERDDMYDKLADIAKNHDFKDAVSIGFFSPAKARAVNKVSNNQSNFKQILFMVWIDAFGNSKTIAFDLDDSKVLFEEESIGEGLAAAALKVISCKLMFNITVKLGVSTPSIEESLQNVILSFTRMVEEERE